MDKYLLILLLSCMLLILSLSGCSSAMVQDSRRTLIGNDLTSFESCAGPPVQDLAISNNEHILVFSTVSVATPTVSASLPILGNAIKPTVTASSASMCRMTARFINGRVYALHFLNNSFFGGYTACAPLVRDCMKFPDSPEQRASISMALHR